MTHDGPILLPDHDRGPRSPGPGTPARPRPSLRRTTSITTAWPTAGRGQLSAVGRDLLTDTDGAAAVVSQLGFTAHLDEQTRQVIEIVASPGTPPLGMLVGLKVASGFRDCVADATHEHVTSTNVLALLLDDLPGAALVSGYAHLHAGTMVRANPASIASRSAICAGWAPDGVMMVAIRRHGLVPTPMGPPATSLQRDDDPMAWHDIIDPAERSTCRTRRLDIWVDDDGLVQGDIAFRDTHRSSEGEVTTFHEYTARISVRQGIIKDLAVTPHVLPWRECPSSVASAALVVGLPADRIKQHVRERGTGESTCTHLDDVLRSMTHIEALARLIPLDR